MEFIPQILETVLPFLASPDGGWIFFVLVFFAFGYVGYRFINDKLWPEAIKCIDWWKAKLAKKENEEEQPRIKQMLQNISSIYNEMSRLMRDTPACRAVLIKASNGGGIPKIGSPFYVSTVLETTDKETPSVMERWSQRLVDESYIRIIIQLLANGTHIIRTKELPDCSLKDTYLSDDIDTSYIIKLHLTEKSLWYLSLNFKEGMYEDTPGFRDTVSAGASTVGRILEQESLYE